MRDVVAMGLTRDVAPFLDRIHHLVVAVAPVLVDPRHKDDAILDGDAEEGDESDQCGDGSVEARERQGHEAARRGEGHREEDEHAEVGGIERDEEKEEDGEEREGNDHLSAPLGALLVLERAGPFPRR